VEKQLRKKRDDAEPLSRAEPKDPAVESLRALRASVHHALSHSDKKVVLLTSSRAGAGRSFVGVNLAALLAAGGDRVLLVDGDLRGRPLKRLFPSGCSGGLAAVLEGGPLDELIHQTHVPRLHLLPAGEADEHTPEKLCGPLFAKAMKLASASYDRIVLIAPPLLPFADAALLAREAGATLLVVKTGDHSEREVSLSLSRLRQAGIVPTAFIANGLPSSVDFYAQRG
jgi:tyrosine-protein kinase Etk/Wzc